MEAKIIENMIGHCLKKGGKPVLFLKGGHTIIVENLHETTLFSADICIDGKVLGAHKNISHLVIDATSIMAVEY